MNNDHFIKVATPQIGDEEVRAVEEVLRSGMFASGPKVAEFERAFAEFIGVEDAAAVSNGTSALYIALEAMGIGEGDEVIVPPMSFFATVSAVIYCRATPVFADIEASSLCMDPAAVEDAVTSRTKAILPVHLFGAAARMDQIGDIAERHDLRILEDCAQAHGTEFKGQKVGGIGTCGAFSFFATKHMTTGEGGIITSNDPEIIKTAKILRSHGMEGRDDHVMIGYNNRLNEIGAALGLVQLSRLNDLNARRIAHSEYLIDRLSDLEWASFPIGDRDNTVNTYFWCPLYVAEETGRSVDDLKKHLDAYKIGYRHRYSAPLHVQPALARAGLDYSDVQLPVAETIAGRVIGLPNHPGLTQSELDRIVEAVRSF